MAFYTRNVIKDLILIELHKSLRKDRVAKSRRTCTSILTKLLLKCRGRRNLIHISLNRRIERNKMIMYSKYYYSMVLQQELTEEQSQNNQAKLDQFGTNYFNLQLHFCKYRYFYFSYLCT